LFLSQLYLFTNSDIAKKFPAIVALIFQISFVIYSITYNDKAHLGQIACKLFRRLFGIKCSDWFGTLPFLKNLTDFIVLFHRCQNNVLFYFDFFKQ